MLCVQDEFKHPGKVDRKRFCRFAARTYLMVDKGQSAGGNITWFIVAFFSHRIDVCIFGQGIVSNPVDTCWYPVFNVQWCVKPRWECQQCLISPRWSSYNSTTAPVATCLANEESCISNWILDEKRDPCPFRCTNFPEHMVSCMQGRFVNVELRMRLQLQLVFREWSIILLYYYRIVYCILYMASGIWIYGIWCSVYCILY